MRRRVKAPREVNVGDPHSKIYRNSPEVPPYPYGEATFYKQSNRGLYGGKVIQFGHQISEYGNKHVRVFHLNVQKVSLWSEILQRNVPIRVVTSVLKTITREGGLDNYLLKDKAARIKELGPAGWALRYEVLKKLEQVERTAPKPIGEIDGKPLYAKVQRNGVEYGVVVGKTRLLKELHTAENYPSTLKAFMNDHQDASIDDILTKLANHTDINPYIVAL